MKKLAVIALLAAMAVPTYSFAQTDDYGNFSSVLSGIGTDSFTKSLEVLDDPTSVQVIKISTFSAGNEAAIQQQISDKAQDIASLQTRVSQSDKAKAALEGAGASAEQVVGISSTGDGTVTLYVNDMESAGGGMTSMAPAAPAGNTAAGGNAAAPANATTENPAGDTAPTADAGATPDTIQGEDPTDTSQSANDQDDESSNNNNTQSEGDQNTTN